MVEFKVAKIDVLAGLSGVRLLMDVEGGITTAGLDELSNPDHPWRVTVKTWRERRSLDANAYCWVLIDKLAEAVGEPATEIYRRAIREIGGVGQTVCVLQEAVPSLTNAWCSNGLGWQAEVFDSRIDGCRNVTLYAGSSTFDTSQMRRLIDRIIQDCEAVGIEVKTPAQVDRLLSLWGDANDEKHHQH